MTHATLTRVLRELPAPSARAQRIVSTVLLGVAAIVVTVHVVPMFLIPGWIDLNGASDARYYVEWARNWSTGGSLYPASQLAGPFPFETGPLYPPSALLLFLPFTVLPVWLFVGIPVAVMAVTFVWLRPARWAWAVTAVCLMPTISTQYIAAANPILWVLAGLAIAPRFGWGATLVMLKPSVFPFALVGFRSRSWWVAMAGWAVFVVLTWALWLDWFTVVRNAQGAGLLYSLKDVPILLIPMVAWLGRRRRESPARVRVAGGAPARDQPATPLES